MLFLNLWFHIFDYVFVLLLDRPDAPKDLEIAKYDQFSTTLEWKKPDTDGGNPIKGYQVSNSAVNP